MYELDGIMMNQKCLASLIESSFNVVAKILAVGPANFRARHPEYAEHDDGGQKMHHDMSNQEIQICAVSRWFGALVR